MEGSLYEDETSPPHNLDTPHIPVARYTTKNYTCMNLYSTTKTGLISIYRNYEMLHPSENTCHTPSDIIIIADVTDEYITTRKN